MPSVSSSTVWALCIIYTFLQVTWPANKSRFCFFDTIHFYCPNFLASWKVDGPDITVPDCLSVCLSLCPSGCVSVLGHLRVAPNAQHHMPLVLAWAAGLPSLVALGLSSHHQARQGQVYVRALQYSAISLFFSLMVLLKKYFLSFSSPFLIFSVPPSSSLSSSTQCYSSMLCSYSSMICRRATLFKPWYDGISDHHTPMCPKKEICPALI